MQWFSMGAMLYFRRATAKVGKMGAMKISLLK
jgi:hypothetical protein